MNIMVHHSQESMVHHQNHHTMDYDDIEWELKDRIETGTHTSIKLMKQTKENLKDVDYRSGWLAKDNPDD
eukprot:12312190-Prorocentrum_lima.AAC.1